MPDKLMESELGNFPPTELELVALFLETAADEFSEHTANDFSLPATDENKAIFLATLRHRETHHRKDERTSAAFEGVMTSADEIFIYDDWLMAYFADRCKTASKNPTIARFTHPELIAIGMLLILAYEDHMEHSDDVPYDLSFPATNENRSLLSSSVDLIAKEHVYYPSYYRQQVAEKIEQVTSAIGSAKEVDIPDYWVMYYLANKCKRLSGCPTFQEIDFPQICS